ncbi:putative anion transporter 6 [Tetrabaena socialis]|uniref:Putative anion transporter 6 n=1 Tax=Tetrabaena socialis TaxID=47790 RepID=A0A2J8A8V4_9CHLO|nr:putative anion transporter 6 [Tetrabaena socialis]|eukprot:PNH08931.1 putative anion transporter 6 [Tetrabaena socialis]
MSLQILTNRVFWALMISHSMFGVIYNTAISWLPRYYNSQFGLDVRSSSFLSVLPWVAMAAGTNLSGWLADHLINTKTLTTTRTRKLLQTLGSVGPAICLLYLSHGAPGGAATAAAAAGLAGGGASRSLAGAAAAAAAAGGMSAEEQQRQLTWAVALLVMTMALLGLQAGGFAATHQDISTRLASVLFGTTNAAASLAGSFFVLLVGVLLDATGSWALVFNLVGLCCLASAAAFLTLASSEPQFD